MRWLIKKGKRALQTSVKASPVAVRACLSLFRSKMPKRIFLGLLAFVLTMMAVVTPLQQQFAAAASTSLDQDIQNWWYYNAIVDCFNADRFEGAQYSATSDEEKQIQPSRLNSGDWFNSGTAVNGQYMDTASPSLPDVGSDGKTACDSKNSQIVTNALKMWNLTPLGVLCGADVVERVTPGMSCTSGNMADSSSSAVTYYQIASDLQNVTPALSPQQLGTALSQRIGNYLTENVPALNVPFGQKAPTLSDADYYQFYLTMFQSKCAAGAKGYSSESDTGASGAINSNNSTVYEIAIQQGSGANVTMVKEYYATKTVGSTSVPTSPLNGTTSCAQIAQKIADPNGTYASAFLKAIKTGAATSSQTCADGTHPAAGQTCAQAAPTCGDAVQGIGWIVCPVINFIGMLNDGMWKLTSGLLNVSPLSTTQASPNGGAATQAPVYTVWLVFLRFGDILMIIAFLVIIYSQLTGAGIGNYGVKKMLPRLIIAVIAANLSFVILQIAVDLSDIIGNAIYYLIKGLAPFPQNLSWGDLVGTAAGLSATGIIAGITVAAAPEVALAIILPAAIAAALGFLAALAVLILRQALIPIMVVIAPVAIALYLFPNTKPWFDKWRSGLVTLLLLFPLAGLLMGGVQLAAAVLGGEGGFWPTLLALIVMGAPLFMLPFIARQAGPMLAKAGSKMQGWADKSRGLTKNAVAPMKERGMENLRHGNSGRFNIGRKMFQSTARKRSDYETVTASMKNANTEAETKRRTAAILSGEINAGKNEEANKVLKRSAIAAQQKEEDTGVADMRKQLELEARGAKNGSQDYYRDKLTEAIQEGDVTKARAAYSQLVSTGLAGVNKSRDVIAEQIAKGKLAKGSDMRKELASHIANNHSDIKNQDVLTSQFATENMDIPNLASVDPNNTTQMKQMTDAVGSLTDQQLAGQTPAFIHRATELGLVTPERATRILGSPMMTGALKESQRAELVVAAGGAPLPAQDGTTQVNITEQPGPTNVTTSSAGGGTLNVMSAPGGGTTNVTIQRAAPQLTPAMIDGLKDTISSDYGSAYIQDKGGAQYVDSNDLKIILQAYAGTPTANEAVYELLQRGEPIDSRLYSDSDLVRLANSNGNGNTALGRAAKEEARRRHLI